MFFCKQECDIIKHLRISLLEEAKTFLRVAICLSFVSFSWMLPSYWFLVGLFPVIVLSRFSYDTREMTQQGIELQWGCIIIVLVLVFVPFMTTNSLFLASVCMGPIFAALGFLAWIKYSSLSNVFETAMERRQNGMETALPSTPSPLTEVLLE